MSAIATPLRLATRGSLLARTQSKMVADMLAPMLGGREVSLEIVKTGGDIRQDLPLNQLGEGVFVKAIEAELLEGHADFAVHSLKDVPTESDPRLTLAAIPTREDPRDALITREGTGFEALRIGAVVATGSPRRIAQLRALREDLRFTGVRGNVDTRLRKLESGEFDALVMAVAGMKRLGIESRISSIFEIDQCVPAVGQGALAVQCRDDDLDVKSLLGSIDSPESRAEIQAERAFLLAIGGGCRIPAGALARVIGNTVHMQAVISDLDGREIFQVSGTVSIDNAPALGEHLAALLRESAQRIGQAMDIRG